MKRFLSTTAFVASLAMLVILGPNESLTVGTNAIASSDQPIKVLDIKVNQADNQGAWLDRLEVQIENTSLHYNLG